MNHPKNYLGYVLAIADDGDTADLYTDHVINDASSGRRGAIPLGLVNTQPDGEILAHLGAETVRFARSQHGSIQAALEEFATWKRR